MSANQSSDVKLERVSRRNSRHFSAFISAKLTVVSVWFMLTADEKHLLRTGQLKTMELSVEGRVQMTLHEQVGLHQLL